jgi:hypothetical protein
MDAKTVCSIPHPLHRDEVKHQAHLEDDQLDFAKGVVANFYNDTRDVLRDLGRPHNPIPSCGRSTPVARFAPAEHEFAVTAAAWPGVRRRCRRPSTPWTSTTAPTPSREGVTRDGLDVDVATGRRRGGVGPLKDRLAPPA